MKKNRPIIHPHSNLQRQAKCIANSLLIEERRISHLRDEVIRMATREIGTS
jgi:hypothetical protein